MQWAQRNVRRHTKITAGKFVQRVTKSRIDLILLSSNKQPLWLGEARGERSSALTSSCVCVTM